MADVKIKATHTVKPAGPAWTGTVKLGEWEQIVAAVYVPTVYFYRHTEDRAVDTLRESLGRVLLHFYPLAGRVHRVAGGRAELLCENQGAELIEAESSSELAEFGDFSCFQKFRHLVPIVDPMRTPIHELPLVCLQVTRFRCGGVTLGLVMNHGVSDGLSAFHFLNEWARLARGEPIQTPPCLDRTLLRVGEPPRGPCFSNAPGTAPPPAPPVMDGVPMAMPPMKETTMVTLPLSKAQIDKLKSAANVTSGDQQKDGGFCPFSRYEVLTAHIWRCTCKAKGSQGEEPKALAITVDARGRVKPPLPTNYFGNAVLMVAATSQAGDLVSRPLGCACKRIRETIASVTGEYILRDIDDLKSLDNLDMMRGIRNPVDLSFALPELGVISWLTLPVHGLDFGWGNHVHMSPGLSAFDGVTHILPGKEGDGSALVVICLQLEHVDKFKNYFYEDIVG